MSKTEAHTLRGKGSKAIEFHMERKAERIGGALRQGGGGRSLTVSGPGKSGPGKSEEGLQAESQSRRACHRTQAAP